MVSWGDIVGKHTLSFPYRAGHKALITASDNDTVHETNVAVQLETKC